MSKVFCFLVMFATVRNVTVVATATGPGGLVWQHSSTWAGVSVNREDLSY